MLKLLKPLKDNKNILIILFSFLAVWGIVGTFNIYLEKHIFITNNILTCFSFFIYLLLFKKILNLCLVKRKIIGTALFSMFVSGIIILGTQCDLYTGIIFNFNTILKIILLAIAVFPITGLIIDKLETIKIKDFTTIPDKKIKWLIFGIILFFNFLVFLAIYPGVYGYDAGYLTMLVKDHLQINTSFSVIYCLLIGNFTNLGKILFDNYQIGFAAFMLLQMLFLTFVATQITTYILNKIQNKFLTIFSILFFSFFPLYTVMVLSSTQDTLFAGIFALLILELLKIIDDKMYFHKKINIIKFSILIFLLCASRNNGIYCILLASPFIIFFIKENRKALFFSIAISLIFYVFIYTGPIFKILNVEKVISYREMLSVPSQQFARVYNYNKKAFNENELKVLKSFYTDISTFDYYEYNQLIADSAKSSINNEEVKKNLFSYIKLWTSIGIKDPQNYIEAYLLNSLGFWYPNKYYSDSRMYHLYIEYNMLEAKKWNENYIEISRESKFPVYEKLLNKIVANNDWQNIPIISLLFSAGMYFILIIFLLILIILYKNYTYISFISVLLSLYITLFLAPVAIFRYVFPILVILPLIISLIFIQFSESNKNKKNVMEDL